MKNIHLFQMVEPNMHLMLEGAWKDNQIEMYYEPIIDVHHSAVAMFELSLRWHTDRYGSLPSKIFFPILKQAEQVEKFDQWIIDQVVDKARMIEMQQRETRLLVPISRRQMEEETFVPHMLRRLEEEDVSASFIIFKISEVPTRVSLVELVRQYKAYGFGIGMTFDVKSSFEGDVETDYVLISRLEVERQTSGGESLLKRILVATLRRVHCQFIVGDIESHRHQQFLEQYGVRFYKGPYFSAPVPFEQLQQRLR